VEFVCVNKKALKHDSLKMAENVFADGRKNQLMKFD
jgi:hypothetical protein